MSLLDKFKTVSVDNSSRIDTKLYEELKKSETTCNNRHDEIMKQVNYLNSYESDSRTHPFKKFAEEKEGASSSMYYNFMYTTFNKINTFYDLSIGYNKYPNKNIHTLDEIIDYFFMKTGGVALDTSAVERLKTEFFEDFDQKYKTPVPTITKTGTITLPKLVYVDTYYNWYPNLHTLDNKNSGYIVRLAKAINLFYNNTIEEPKDLFDGWESTDHRDKYNKGKIEINKMGIESVNMSGNGNVKVKFIDKTDALKFFQFFNLDKCKPRD